MMEIVIASANRAKIRHIRECIKSISSTVQTRSFVECIHASPSKKEVLETKDAQPNRPVDFPLSSMVEKDSPFAAAHSLAIEKALHGLHMTGLPCLADETLLIVPALGSIETAFHQKDLWKQSKQLLPDTKSLLQSLQGKKELDRFCYLETVLVLALPGTSPTIQTVHVRQEGSLAEEERGSASFDFGSLFIKHEYNKTLSELPEATLTRISHRRKGLEKLFRACSIS